MPNSVQQNPMNKVGRNSGAGRTGVSRLVPTPREAARGVREMDLDDSGTSGWVGRLGVGLGVASALGAGIAVLAARRARRRRSLRSRLERFVGRG
ncbi:MAG TPA: hypothetical protein VFL93_09545 [Longimicrobiaceae bacterium]|nr:hypothetical protein [Longimicrobiaceae bacterium]